MLSVGRVANPHWSTWLGYGTFTPVDRVRFPDAELFYFISLNPLCGSILEIAALK